MTALFSLNQQSKATQNLVEFRAGKMQVEGTTVTADPRKGTFCMKFNSDNVLRLTWTDRTTNKVEDDLMILPDEVEFVKVPECKTGRVFLLRWKSHPRRLFFWMQEPDTSKDETLFKRVSELVKKPEPVVTSSRDSNFPGSILEKIVNLPGAPQEIYDFFRSMNQQDSPRSPTRESTSSPAVATTAAPPESSARAGPGFLQFDDIIENYRQVLRQALKQASSTQGGKKDDMPAGETTAEQSVERPRQPDFARALSWKNLKPFFDEHPEALDALKDKLPEGRPKTAEEVMESFTCPQVAQTKRILGYVITASQFKPIADQFGMSSESITEALQKGDLIAFCRALEALESHHQEGVQEDSNMDELD